MCRNIRTLYNYEPPVTNDEIDAAAIQFVRKVSGFTRPSKANEAAFAEAIKQISETTKRLMNQLETKAAPKNREQEAVKAKERSARRYATQD